MRVVSVLVVFLALSPGPALRAAPAQPRRRGVATAVGACVAKVNARVRRCYADTGVACSAADPAVLAAVAKLEKTITARCHDDVSTQAAGFGALVTPAAVAERAREA